MSPARKYPLHFLLLLVLTGSWLALSSINLFQDDDLVMLRSVQQDGIIKATQLQWESWNTRWTSFLLLHSWMRCWNEESSPLFYHLFTLICLYLSCFRLVCGMQGRLFLNEGKSNAYFFSGLMVAALLTATYHPGDTWFWVNTSTMYGWNLIVIITALSLCISPCSSRLLQWALMALCGLFTGGAAEPAVASLLLLIPVFIVLRYPITGNIRAALILFLLFLLLGFAVSLAGEGHSRRSDALPTVDGMDYLLRSTYFSAKLLLYHTPIRLMLVLVILLPLAREIPDSKAEFISDRALLFVGIGWLLTIALHGFFITWIMGDYGPARAWSFISLVTVIASFLFLRHFHKKAWLTFLQKVQPIVLLVLVCYILFRLYQSAHYVEQVISTPASTSVSLPAEGFLHRKGY